ncbi:probable dolichyl pyrophosphate Man9GlcNAc2 alpha-1,3-glucosyltransferase [Anopheles ziemanni]|uniref:probable dolichyl pyrophosphate Man9GlcNAc2 alpha-1,3-glucosyltransferase n=1 Tax=Anopheles coustani TaxID=139045 RepID=UPI00265AD6B6|nr:probable dolichyl pyrophosphate Man9GlcNAc2 alpha-1,3-glucosyltransferase [Anopheles coustani]XP_058168321.1 probable dolichyl pyrophosphate Man9GlcNAc2 alpha-1,3-glucosyltransferase [Anopheles ziemanni]
MDGSSKPLWIALAATGVFLRASISLHSYSGQNRPPMYGDYEAQRHWQEVTVNLPVTDWYRNTTDNDLLYWGLDYPPLTAYHSYLVGTWARFTQRESFVALHTSRGIGTEKHKHFMRNTVLLADVLLYIPAMLFALHAIRRRLSKTIPVREEFLLALAVLYPGQILIDNGHFQYNNISLALCTLAVVAIGEKATLLGAILFCLALNYKQMELYHALPFFFYLLRDCFSGVHSNATTGRRLLSGLKKLSLLGVTVLATFGILWLPWLRSIESLGQLVHRIFPVARGVFEDKVSNVWCVVNVLVKLKNFPVTTMALICLLCTALAVLPSGIHLLLQKTPNMRSFLYSLAVTALGFFLFSFQVHEKSILLAALPVVLLLPAEPLASYWLLQVSTFSMLPLLHKDGLMGAYLGLTLVSLTLPRLTAAFESSSNPRPTYDVLHVGYLLRGSVDRTQLAVLTILFYASLAGQGALLLGFLYLPPPAHLPFLYPLAISAYSCGHFVLFFLYFNYRQMFSGESSTENKSTKVNKMKK